MPETQQTPLLEDVISTIVVILRIVFETLVSLVKAFLPCGILPRKSVSGEVVLITGSGSGIGRLMAIEFGKLGARLVLWDINDENNRETERLLTEKGVEAHAYKVDLSKRAEIYAAAERVKSEVGNVNILINNAGIVNGHKFFETTDEAMENTMIVNTNSLFFTTKAFLREMLSTNHGHVVVVASMAGKFGSPGLVDYCASKFGAVGFADSLAAELYALKKTDVHVTTVCPFFINTGMFDGVRSKSPRLFPILEPDYVVEQTMEAILTNRAVLLMPKTCYFVSFLSSFLPSKVTFVLSDYFGLYESMDHFVGRSGKQN